MFMRFYRIKTLKLIPFEVAVAEHSEGCLTRGL
jgi:hypothetical protein